MDEKDFLIQEEEGERRLMTAIKSVEKEICPETESVGFL